MIYSQDENKAKHELPCCNLSACSACSHPQSLLSWSFPSVTSDKLSVMRNLLATAQHALPRDTSKTSTAG